MSANRPDRGEGVVLKDIAEVVEAANEKNGLWPELEEPKFEEIPQRPSFAERVTLWTMAGTCGAVTIYAIATSNQEVLIAILTIAAGTLLRLTRRPEKDKPGKRTYDPRTKGRQRKGTRSG